MPTVNPPRPSSPLNSNGQVIGGYIESIESQANNNWPAIQWFLEHHESIEKGVRLYNATRLIV